MGYLSDWTRWRSLELTLHMMELPPARSPSIPHQKPQIRHLVENPRNESYSSWAHHEQDWRCWWCPWSGAGASFSFIVLPSNLFSKLFLSLVLGFILVLRVLRERERVANEWISEKVGERVWLQLMKCPNSCLHVGPTLISGKQLISHLLLLYYDLSYGPAELADCPVSHCLC